MNTITGTVTHVQRKGHTIYGNPIMDVTLIANTDEPHHYQISDYRISDNASLIYAIENPEFKESPHTFALTRAGRISKVIR
jgi:hypothetical protein